MAGAGGWSGYGGSIGLATGSSFVGSTLGRAVVIVGADTRQLAAGLANAERMVGSFAAKTDATLAQRVGMWGRRIGTLGGFITRTFGVAAVAVGVATARMAADFQSEMAKIVGLSNLSAGAVKGLSVQVMGLAKATGVGPQKLAEALYFIASSGIKSAKEAFGILTVAAKMSAAGMGDASVSADALTSALNAYRGTGLTAARAADILTAAVREGKGETDAIAMSIGAVIPSAVQLGVTFDQVAASVAAATDVGLPATRAVTGLRYALQDLLNPSAKAETQLVKVFGSIDNLHKAIENQGFLAVLQKLKAGLSEADFNTALGGIRGVVLALTLVGKNSEQVQGIFDRIASPQGSLNRAFGVQTHTTLFKFHQALATLEVDAIKLGNVMLPVATQIITKVNQWLLAFSNLNVETLKHIVYWGLLIAAAGPALFLFGKLLTIGSKIFESWSRANRVINGIFGMGSLSRRAGPMEAAAASMGEAAASIEGSAASMTASYERVAVAAETSASSQAASARIVEGAITTEATVVEGAAASEVIAYEQMSLGLLPGGAMRGQGLPGGGILAMPGMSGVRGEILRPNYTQGMMFMEGGAGGSGYSYGGLAQGKATIEAEQMMASVDRTLVGRMSIMGTNARAGIGRMWGGVSSAFAAGASRVGTGLLGLASTIFSPLNVLIASGLIYASALKFQSDTISRGTQRVLLGVGPGATDPTKYGYQPSNFNWNTYYKQGRQFGESINLPWYERGIGNAKDIVGNIVNSFTHPFGGGSSHRIGYTQDQYKGYLGVTAAQRAYMEVMARYNAGLGNLENTGGYVYSTKAIGGQTPAQYARGLFPGDVAAQGMATHGNFSSLPQGHLPFWSNLSKIPGTGKLAYHVGINQILGAEFTDKLSKAAGSPEQKTNIQALAQQYFALTGSMKGANLAAVQVELESGNIDAAVAILQHHVELATKAFLKHEKGILTNKDAYKGWAANLAMATRLMPESKDKLGTLINAIYANGGALKGNNAELFNAYLQTGKYDKANQLLVQQLYHVERQSGKTRGEAEKYIAKLLHIPKSVVTELLLDTTAAQVAMDKWAQEQANKGIIISPPGGYQIHVQSGGLIPGTGYGDKIPALLEPGEFVFTRRATQNMGGGKILQSMMKHAERFATGGEVQPTIDNNYSQFLRNLLELTRIGQVNFDANLVAPGGGNFPGGGGVSGGWGAAGSPHANFYRAAVQSAWPGLRFGGMYNRRYIKGTQVWSQHAYGNAVDEMVPSLAYGDQVAAWVKARAGLFSLDHLLWRVPDHFNHVHADFWPQGYGVPGGGGGGGGGGSYGPPPRRQWMGGYGEFNSPTMLSMMVGDRSGREFVHVGQLGPSRSHVGFTNPVDLAAMEDVMTRAVEVGVERAMTRVLSKARSGVFMDGYRVGTAHGIDAIRSGNGVR